MNNELMLWATGEVVARRRDRAVAGRAKRIYDEVREKDLMARGAFALGADIMDQTAMLFAKGKALSGGDPVLSRLLAEEVVNTLDQARHIQNSLFEDRVQGRRRRGF